MPGVDAKQKKELLDGFYQRLKEHPIEWQTTADNLRAGAMVLFEAWRASTDENGEPIRLEHLHLVGPACLLYGCYLENLIKGYLIMKHGSFKAASDANKGFWGKHHLHDLAVATGLPLTNDQKMLLRSAEAWVRWAGRYPVSLKREEFTIPKQFGAGEHVPPVYLQIVEREELEPFCKALAAGIHSNHLAYLSNGQAK